MVWWLFPCCKDFFFFEVLAIESVPVLCFLFFGVGDGGEGMEMEARVACL